MGIDLKAPQALNYGDYLTVANNPISKGFADSAYASSNRNFDAEGMMAKYFAPLSDQGYTTYGNLIRT